MSIERTASQQQESESDDPVARKLSWRPAASGGSNVKTQRLVAASRAVKVKPTFVAALFGYLFVLFGLVPVPVMVIPAFQDGHLLAGLFTSVVSAILIIGGIGFVRRAGNSLLTFDTVVGRYYYSGGKPGRQYRNGGRLSDIHALQLLAKKLRSRSGEGGWFICYELNLVLVDSRRITVMAHGSLKDIRASASALSQFLGVPVWEAPEVGRPEPRERGLIVLLAIYACIFSVLLLGNWFGG